MRFGVRILVGCLVLGTLVAAFVVALMPRTASDRSGPLLGDRMAAVHQPGAANRTPPPPTADPADVTSDQNLVDDANRFLAVDLVVVSGLGLIIVASVGWLVVQVVRGGEF